MQTHSSETNRDALSGAFSTAALFYLMTDIAEPIGADATRRRALFIALLGPLLNAAAAHFANFTYRLFPDSWSYSDNPLLEKTPLLSLYFASDAFTVALLYGASVTLFNEERPLFSYRPVAMRWWLLGLAGDLFNFIASEGIVWGYSLFRIHGRSVLSSFGHPPHLIGIFLLLEAGLLAPIIEEMVFRGWLYTGLRSYMSFPSAAVASAMVFSFFHFSLGLPVLTYTFVFGVTAALLRERSNSLIPSTVMHIGMNTASAILYLRLF